MIENPVEWFQSKTTELENDFKKKDVLLDMKSVVLNSEERVLNEIAHNVSLNSTFECLFSCDKQDVEVICIILNELLSQMSAGELFEVYSEPLYRCFSHPSETVKETILKLLEKSINENAIESLKKHIPLLVNVAECLKSPERSTAQGAISMLTKLGNYSTGLKLLYSTSVLQKLKEIMTINDVSKFRVYEIIVEISKQSSENLSASISTGIMENLLAEISSSDILIQLNALEMLSTLASSNHGLNYLQEHTIIQNLVDKLLKINEEPLSLVLLPGLVEFFGNLCTLQPEHFANEYPQVMDLLFNSLETVDEVLLGVIISTVGKIGSSCSGRLVLSKYDDHMNNVFKKIGQIMKITNDATITAVNSLCELMKNINNDVHLNAISNRWFDSITPEPLESILTLSKLPFIEFRLAALGLLKTIATQEWGTTKLCSYPGMIEFLTDRSTEFHKDCKETKFEVVFNMTQCSNIEQEVSEQTLLNLKEFIKEGPFFVPTQVEMVTEGAL